MTVEKSFWMLMLRSPEWYLILKKHGGYAAVPLSADYFFI
jgi:hypothetical protein